MNSKIGSFIISKPVWIRLGLIGLLAALFVVLHIPFYFPIWGLIIPIQIGEIVQQFCIDNGYAGDNETPEH